MVAYHYDFRIALVKGSPNTVAANATVLVYDPADTAYATPVTVYSNPALTTIVNLVTDQHGIVPDFWSDKPDLLWKSGTMTGGWATTTSRPGIRGATGPAGKDSTIPGPQGNPGLDGAGTNADVAAYVTASGQTRDALDARFTTTSALPAFIGNNLPARLAQAALDGVTDGKIGAAFTADKADPLKPWKDALQNQKTAAAKYVNLGDSIANGGNPTTGSRAWVNRVTALLTNRLADRLDAGSLATPATTGVHVYNGAVGGTTSATYLTDALVTRIGTIQPQLVTHMVKANDQGAGMAPATYRANLLSWINKIKAVSPATVHVLINEHDRYDLANPTYSGNQYRDQLISLAASETNVVFLDIGAEFKTHGIPGSDRYGLMHTDNLHFNDDGNRVYARTIGKFIGAPTPDYIPREIRKATTFNYATYTAPGTVSSFVIKPKPYLREGVLVADIYGRVTAGSAEINFRMTPTGGTRVDLGTHRMVPGSVSTNNAGSVPISLEPNTEYTVFLDVGVYTSTLVLDGNSAYMQFYADISPV